MGNFNGPLKERKLAPEEIRQLVEGLLNCQIMRDRHSRDTVVELLDDKISQVIPRHPTSNVDVTNIVKRCLNYEGGLNQLFEIIESFEHNSLPMQQLTSLLERLFATPQVTTIEKQNISRPKTVPIAPPSPQIISNLSTPMPSSPQSSASTSAATTRNTRGGFSFGKKCVCPSCFEVIYPGECAIVSLDGKTLKTASKGLNARINVEPLDGHKYAQESAHRLCYECGYLLPYTTDFENKLHKNIRLAIVGDIFSGKSHYIASLIHQMKQEWVGNAHGFMRINCLTREIEQIYLQDYFELLFKHKRVLQLTRPARKSTAEPLIYQFVVGISPKHPPTTFNLMIYDTSGEDFQSERLTRFARFVPNASAFIFIVDPFSIPAITYQMPQMIIENEFQHVLTILQKRGAVEIFNDAIKLFERYHGYQQGSRLPDIPIAIMLSKSDLLKYTTPPGSYSPLITNPYYGHGLNLRDIDSVDQEVRDLLIKYRQGDLLAATNHLKQVKFFATSATGGPPDGSGNYMIVEPCRCLDPLLWILYRLGAIQGH